MAYGHIRQRDISFVYLLKAQLDPLERGWTDRGKAFTRKDNIETAYITALPVTGGHKEMTEEGDKNHKTNQVPSPFILAVGSGGQKEQLSSTPRNEHVW